MQVKRLTPTAQLPTKAYTGDAGWDLYADNLEELRLSPGDRLLIPTGCSFVIPEGYYGRLADRSSIAWKHGCHVLAGVIDSSYRGEVKVVITNLSPTPFFIQPGEKLCQMVITQIYTGGLVEVSELGETDRNEGGFGSSNN